MTDPNQAAAKALRDAADALDPDHGTARGMDIEAMIAGRQAQLRELAEWAHAQANGGQYPDLTPTDQQAARGLRRNETMVDGRIVPIDERED